MRLLAALVASGLAALAAASHVAQLSPDETRLLLAERLGVSRFHALQLPGESVRKTTGDIAAALGRAQLPADALFAETPRKGHFVLALAGMEDNRLDPRLPALAIAPAAPFAPAALLAALAAQKAAVASLHADVFSKTRSGAVCVSVPALEELAPFDSTLSHLPPALRGHLAALDPATAPSHAAFLSEFTMILKFTEVVLPGLPEDGFSYCHAPALAAFIAAVGPASPEAHAASTLYSHILHQLPSSIASTVLLLPQPPALSKRTETPLSMPQPEPSSATPAKKLFNPPLCHSSKESCEASTADCSGRGSCVKIAKAGPSACWSCKCTPTRSKTPNGKKSTIWAGAACQKKDVSVPFNIFLGFGIVVVFVVIAAVNLMYSIGEEPLPSVLGAGVAPAAKRT